MTASTPMGDPRPFNPAPETVGQTFFVGGGGGGGSGRPGEPTTVEFGGPSTTVIPETEAAQVLQAQLGPHVVKQVHRPASPISVARVLATPDVAAGDNFQLLFVLGHSSILPDRTLEHLTVLAQKYVLDDGDVLVTFTETVEFTVHDAFLLPDARNISGAIICQTFNAQGDSRTTWNRPFNQVRVVKSAGNAATVTPYMLTLRFSNRKFVVSEPGE